MFMKGFCPPGQQPGGKSKLMEIQDLLAYWKIVRKWWWVVLVCIGATVGSMLIFTLTAETQYKATVTMQISAPPPQEVPLYSTVGRQALQEEILQTQSGISELLLEGDVVYYTLRDLPEVPMTPSELRQRIEVEIPKDSQLMRVSVSAPDSELAALLANALAEVGLRRYAEFAARSTTNTRQFIEEQLNVAQQEYEKAELELTEFQVTNKIGSLSTAINEQYDLIETLKTQRDLAEAEGDAERRQTLERIILQREAELQNVIGLSSDYYTLVGRVDRARDTYNFMLDKRAEAQIKENQILELGSIQIITLARPPSRPAAPLAPKIVVLGAIVSLLAGILLAFLLEYIAVSADSQQSQAPEKSSSTERVRLAEPLENTSQ
jgi:uncharacterized protein involved in exopolysaccharide biosynthesis